MNSKQKKISHYIGKWVVPITKDTSNKSELKKLIFDFETKIIKLKNNKYAIFRKLTYNDIKSLDFIKYVLSQMDCLNENNLD